MTETPIVRLRYHSEEIGDGSVSWWADSPDLDGFSAAGDTFDAVRREAIDGVAFFVGAPTAIVEEGLPLDPHAPGEGAGLRVQWSAATFTGSVLHGAHAVEVAVGEARRLVPVG
jgi:predicted RNase H-like HicB family nuclease